MSDLHPELRHYFTERMNALLSRAGAARMVLFAQASKGSDVTPVASAGGEALISFESFPVELGERRLGVIRAESAERPFFTPESKQTLEALAAQLAPLWAVSPSSQPAAIALDKKIAVLKDAEPRFDWCGIYRVKGESLHLTAFRGAPTPHPIIDTAKGICGAAVRENQTLNIRDVKSDPRYLACDLHTRSELVVPIRDAAGEAIAELDIDSRTPNAFDDATIRKMEQLARELPPLMIKFTE